MIADNKDIIVDETSSESDSLDISEHKRSVFFSQGDPEIISLYNKWKDGDLNIQPEFQRGFVWDIIKASRLIESILLDIPLPMIYLSQEDDNVEYVIDGQQRLTTFFSFIDGNLPDPTPKHAKDFHLSSLKVFTELNGKKYKDLPTDYQKKIKNYNVRTITFRKESEPDLKFEVFERLNTGSVSLNDQELRNCIYRGPYNDLLIKMSQEHTFKELMGIKKPERRMKDVEYVLRFAAFYHSSYLNYKPPMRKFLNNEMEKYRNISENDAADLITVFKNTISILKSLLGTHAFNRYYIKDQKPKTSGWQEGKFNASLYDILMDSFSRRDRNRTMENLDSIREALIHLMTSDRQFIASIELSTSSTQAIHTRFTKWINALDSIYSVGEKEPRCFSIRLKKELYSNNPYCAICNQRISEVDDAAIDHIYQYWMGGKTIPENARLTHRYCNNHRARLNSPEPIINPPTTHFKRRTRIIQIEKKSIYCKTSVDVLKETATYLVKKGKISSANCPLYLSGLGNKCIINTVPYHPDGTEFYKGGYPLPNNLFLHKTFSSDDCIINAKGLLAFCGILPNDYDLQE